METGYIVLWVCTVIVGVVVGILLGRTMMRRRYRRDTQYTQGTLNADCRDRDADPGLYLGLNVPAKDIVSRKYVMFDIKRIT